MSNNIFTFAVNKLIMTKLITCDEINIVYFSECIKDFRCYGAITKILDKYQVKHELLSFTNEYWVRDYMPVQRNF